MRAAPLFPTNLFYLTPSALFLRTTPLLFAMPPLSEKELSPSSTHAHFYLASSLSISPLCTLTPQKEKEIRKLCFLATTAIQISVTMRFCAPLFFVPSENSAPRLALFAIALEKRKTTFASLAFLAKIPSLSFSVLLAATVLSSVAELFYKTPRALAHFSFILPFFVLLSFLARRLCSLPTVLEEYLARV